MLKSEFRQWIIQEKIGLLTKCELIQLADNYITEHEAFPIWMTKISLNESLEGESSLDLTLEKVNDIDCKNIANILLKLHKNGSIERQKLGCVADKLYPLLDEDCEAYDFFMWVSDEVDLINSGYDSKTDFDAHIEKSLGELSAL